MENNRMKQINITDGKTVLRAVLNDILNKGPVPYIRKVGKGAENPGISPLSEVWYNKHR